MTHFESTPAESFGFKEILYSKAEWVATITINRPHNYNAYSTPALEELATAFRDAAFDDSVGVIVYTGAGHRAFCTGGDVKEYEQLYTNRPRDYWKYMRLFRSYIESIVNTGKPVVARLNGMAVGGGNESQMACDLAVMAEHAWIGQVGTRVGSVAAGGATQWLPILIGDRRAREMLLFNGRIPAHQALDWGLVNRVVPSVTKDGGFIEGASKDEIKKALAEADQLLEGPCLASDGRACGRLARPPLLELRAVGGHARVRREAETPLHGASPAGRRGWFERVRVGTARDRVC